MYSPRGGGGGGGAAGGGGPPPGGGRGGPGGGGGGGGPDARILQGVDEDGKGDVPCAESCGWMVPT